MSVDENNYKNLSENFRNIKLILFDLDDTLISESDWYLDKWKKCDHYLEKKYGILGFFEKIFQIIEQHGFDYPKKIDDALIELNISEKITVKEIFDYYISVQVIPVVFPNVHEILSQLKKTFHLGIITSGKTWEQKLKIKSSNLDKYFQSIDVLENKSKDSSIPFTKCLDFFSTSSENTLYVGNDPFNDFVGAKSIKIKTIRLLQGIHKETIVSDKFNADLTFDSLEDFNKKIFDF